MGARLSKKKKGCYGDTSDDKGEESSESPTIEQQENETEAEQGQKFADTVSGGQVDSSTLQSEEKSKSELNDQETGIQEKSADKSTQEHTKESEIPLMSPDMKSAAIELVAANGQEMHSEPTVVSSVTAEQISEKIEPVTAKSNTKQLQSFPIMQTKEKSEIEHAKDPTAHSPAEKNVSETCSETTSEITSNVASVEIHSSNGGVEKPTKCVMGDEQIISDEPVCSSATEDTKNAQSATNEQDSPCSNTETLLQNDTDSNLQGSEIRDKDTCPDLLPQAMNKSEGDTKDIGQSSSNDDADPVSCDNAYSNNQGLDDGNKIDNHELVATVSPHSDNLVVSPTLHKDASINRELLEPAQEIKLEDSKIVSTECTNIDNKCSVKGNACDTMVEDSVATEKDDCSTKAHEAAPLVETLCLPETKPNICLAQKLEAPTSLDACLAQANLETKGEAKSSLCQATKLTTLETDGLLAQTEVASINEQAEDSNAETEISVAPMVMESTTEPEAHVETGSPAEVVCHEDPEEEISSSQAESCMAPKEVTSSMEACAVPAEEASSSELKACVVSEEVLSLDKKEHAVVNLKVAFLNESEKDMPLTEVEFPVEQVNGVSSIEGTTLPGLEECMAQTTVASTAEPEAGLAQTEVAPIAEPEDIMPQTEVKCTIAPDEHDVVQTGILSVANEDSIAKTEVTSAAQLKEGVVEEAVCINKLQDSVAQSQVSCQAEMEDCLTNKEVASPSKQESFVIPENTSSTAKPETYEAPAEMDCSSELDICEIISEQGKCEITVKQTPELETHATPVEASTPNPEMHKGSAQVAAVIEADACNALVKQEDALKPEEEQPSSVKTCTDPPVPDIPPVTVQETEIHLESISVNKAESPNHSDIQLSSENVICEEELAKSNGVNNEVILTNDS
ncbi:uro-adherence factor A-like [Ambystoma mexicanum]|uniref:uro-adherence factor A-like n=1 Tax=Ambystoma mexicanum TaxID=8296 RepID=UPI0037E869EE